MAVSDYRRGDVETPYGSLRLSIGALAEITEKFEASSPKSLAEAMRSLTPEKSVTVLRALLRPCRSNALKLEIAEDDIPVLMTAAASCIVQALEPKR